MRIVGMCMLGLVVLILVRDIAALMVIIYAGYCLFMAGLWVQDVGSRALRKIGLLR